MCVFFLFVFFLKNSKSFLDSLFGELPPAASPLLPVVLKTEAARDEWGVVRALAQQKALLHAEKHAKSYHDSTK